MWKWLGKTIKYWQNFISWFMHLKLAKRLATFAHNFNKSSQYSTKVFEVLNFRFWTKFCLFSSRLWMKSFSSWTYCSYLILSVIMLNVIILSLIILNVGMLSVVKLSVILVLPAKVRLNCQRCHCVWLWANISIL